MTVTGWPTSKWPSHMGKATRWPIPAGGHGHDDLPVNDLLLWERWPGDLPTGGHWHGEDSSPSCKRPVTWWPTSKWPSLMGKATRWPTCRWPQTWWPTSKWPSYMGKTTRWPTCRWPLTWWPTSKWPHMGKATRGPTCRWPQTWWPTSKWPHMGKATRGPTCRWPQTWWPTSKWPHMGKATSGPTCRWPRTWWPTSKWPSHMGKATRWPTCRWPLTWWGGQREEWADWGHVVSATASPHTADLHKRPPYYSVQIVFVEIKETGLRDGLKFCWHAMIEVKLIYNVFMSLSRVKKIATWSCTSLFYGSGK